MRLPLTRCTTATKDGVGVIHMHAAWWRPATVREVWFQPEGRDVLHRVPDDVVEQVFAAETFEQMMALIRDAPQQPAH